jgi:protein O-mannosyl-transferase
MVVDVKEMSAEAPPVNFAEARGEDRRMKQLLCVGLLVAAVVLVYGNTLWNEFTMDDELYIFMNPQVTTPTAGKLFMPNQASNVYRPLTFATLALNWRVSPRPLWFHVVNLLLHAGATCLLYFLLRTLLASFPRGQIIAFAAALLFAVHPIHTEAVTWIVGRSEVLAAGFLFAAWIFHLQDREIPALACFVLALLSKESAAVFLPLMFVGDYARGKFKPYFRYVRIAAITLMYIGVLWKVQGGHFGMAGVSKMDNPLGTLPAIWRILNALHVAWKYIALQVYPAALSCDYSFNEIPVYMDLRHTLPWAMATLAVFGAWMLALHTEKKEFVLAGGMYMAGFAVTANVLLLTGTIMGERLAYLPSAGFCLLAALAWNWLRERRATVAFGLLAIVVTALGVRTVVRNRDWKDNLSLFRAAVKAAPGSEKMHADLGRAYLDHGQNDLARKELDTALQIYPDDPGALASYGVLEFRAGNYHAAGRMMEHSFYICQRNDPNYNYIAVNLAAVYMQTDHLDAALELLDRIIAERPDYGRAWANRAVLHYKRGETVAARNDAETALRLDPGNSQAQNLMRMLRAAPQSFR